MIGYYIVGTPSFIKGLGGFFEIFTKRGGSDFSLTKVGVGKIGECF